MVTQIVRLPEFRAFMREVNPPECFALLLVLGELYERAGASLRYDHAVDILTEEVSPGVPNYDGDPERLLEEALNCGIIESHNIGGRECLTSSHVVQILPPTRQPVAPKPRVIDLQEVLTKVWERMPEVPEDFARKTLQEYEDNDWRDGMDNKVRTAASAANKICFRWERVNERSVKHPPGGEKRRTDFRSALA